MAQARTPSPANRQAAARTTQAVIGAGTRVRGRVTGDGDLTVLGQLEGEVSVRGELFIEKGGRVTSDIDAGALRVAGTLDGDVHVTGDVTLLAGSNVSGDLHGARVSLEEGAVLDGRLDSEFDLPSELGETSRAAAHKATARR